MRFLRGFMNRGTLLFVSHDTGTVSTLCQRALWLHKGQLILDERAPLVAETYLECLAEEAWGGEGGDERAEIIRRTALERIASRAAARAQEAAPKALDVFAPAPLPLQPLSGNLEIGARDVSGSSFGHGGARIVEVDLVGEGDEPLASLRGGEVVTLKVRVEAHAALESPIVGFVVKDRLGQALFGENTFEIYRAQPRQVLAGEMLEARFTFVAPVLAPGDYSIGVAVADGTQLQHVQHHWIHDAVIFRSVTQSVATGLMGIPMRAVTLSALSTPAR
jgi:lipopolysaccharide transport system ATP-binding protein